MEIITNKFARGRNKPGTKVFNFLNGEEIFCKNHGFHRNYEVYSDNSTLKCRFCNSDRQKLFMKNNNIRHILKRTRSFCKTNNIEFDLNEDNIKILLEKQYNKCVLSGLEFDDTINRISIDRIIPGKSYTLDNIQLVTYAINRMKTNIQQDRFQYLCNQISSYNQNI